jgi:hypothetical protein
VGSFKENTIINSFKATGISSLNPDVILKRFVDTHPDEQGSRVSSASVLSGSDWKKIERLVKVVAKDINDEETKKLSRSLHSISVQNELLKYENRGLRAALASKREGQKRSKPFDLQQRKEYHGGSVFWSPRKVKEARVRQTVKERGEKELQSQKAERAELKKADKLYKARILQEKRVARAAAKVTREQEKAEQAASRTQKQSAQRAKKALRQRIRLVDRGKKQAVRLPIVSEERKKEAPKVVNGIGDSGVVSAAQPVITRCGRNIKVPNKFE